MTPPGRPTIRAIAEVVLNVRDIAAMTRFYGQVLGFAEFSRSPEDNPTIVFLRLGELAPPFGDYHPQCLVLIDPARHAYAAGKFDTPSARTSTLNHLAFQIPDDAYDAELDRLASLGLSPTTAEFPALRSKAIFFRDPEGNTLELICHDPNSR